MSEYFLGVDWADKVHRVCVLDGEGHRIHKRSVADTAEGFADLSRWLYERMGEGVTFSAAIEKVEGRWVDFLLDCGVEVYPVAPKSMDRIRDRYRANQAKSDEFDAYVLADHVRTDRARLTPLAPNSPHACELKLLTRDYHSLVQQQTRLLNQVKTELKAYYPRVLEMFNDLNTPAVRDFLRTYPTAEALEGLSLKRWQRFGKAHRFSHGYIQKQWEELCAPQLPIPAHVVRARSRKMLVLLDQLEVTARAVSDYKKEIETFFSSLPVAELARTLPGGKSGVIVPSVFAELGDAAGRWSSFRHLQAQAGATPYTKQSGKIKTAHFRFACNKHLRYAMHWFAHISLTQSEWARAYYDRQRAKGHTHRQALRALGSKWLKIIFVMWRDRVPYDENHHLANITRQHFKQAVWA